MKSEILVKKNPRISFMTYGCRANQYDTAVLEKQVKQRSWKIVSESDQADYCVVNSCAITHNADHEAKRYLGKIHRKNPEAVLVVTGCSAQVQPEFFKKIEGVALVVGNENKNDLISLIEKSESGPSFNSQNNFHFDSTVFDGGLKLSKHSRSFLKIQDGCSQFCSFCIVPFARGLNRSIPPEVVLKSLRDLGSQGVDEVVLTGIHLGTYGKDLNPRTSFFDLLRLIDRERPVKRVRLSSIDPEEMSPDLISFLTESDFFCPHLHLPLQSGDNSILEKMRRRYTGEYFIDLCQKILEKRSDFCLGTDVIVGFPAETERAFERTVQVLKDSGLSYLHVFPYSERLGTKAALFSHQVSLEEKKVRSRYLRQVSEKLRKQFYQKFIGFTRPAILENRRQGLTALTDNYISVEIKALDQYVVGSLVNVTIEGLTGPMAYGCLVEKQSHSAFYI